MLEECAGNPPELLAVARATDADDVRDAREPHGLERCHERALHVTKELVGDREAGDGELRSAVRRKRVEEVLAERPNVRGTDILRERPRIAIDDDPEIEAGTRHAGEEVALADPHVEPEVRMTRDDVDASSPELGRGPPLEDARHNLIGRYANRHKLLDESEDLAPRPAPIDDDANGVAARHRSGDRAHLLTEQRSTGSRDLTKSLECVEVSQASHLDHVVGRWSEVAVERYGDDRPPAGRRGRSTQRGEWASECPRAEQERIWKPAPDDREKRVGDRARPDARQWAPADRAEPPADEHVDILRKEERLRRRADERTSPEHRYGLRGHQEQREWHLADESTDISGCEDIWRRRRELTPCVPSPSASGLVVEERPNRSIALSDNGRRVEQRPA